MVEAGTKIRFVKDGWRVATGIVLKDLSILQVYPYTRTSSARLNPKGFIVHRGPFRSLEEWRENFEKNHAIYVDSVAVWKKGDKGWNTFEYENFNETLKRDAKTVRILRSFDLKRE
jgi:hypothetical protein